MRPFCHGNEAPNGVCKLYTYSHSFPYFFFSSLVCLCVRTSIRSFRNVMAHIYTHTSARTPLPSLSSSLHIPYGSLNFINYNFFFIPMPPVVSPPPIVHPFACPPFDTDDTVMPYFYWHSEKKRNALGQIILSFAFLRFR